MSRPLVVANAGPLVALSLANALGLLEKLFGVVLVPAAASSSLSSAPSP